MLTKLPQLGRYLKIIKSGEIVENKGFNPKTPLIVDVESKTGVISVGRNEVAEITANEKLEFLRSQNHNSN